MRRIHPSFLPLASLGGVALALLVLSPLSASGLPPAPPELDASLWPESQRAFFQDGPALLVAEEQRQALAAQGAEERGAWMKQFLDRDPLPETPANELREGIARRQRLADASFGSPTDVRWQLIFLNGPPEERKVLDCGIVFHPVEVWTYLRGVDGQGKPDRKMLVVYQGEREDPWKLWLPADGKRALYVEMMQGWLEQWEELRGAVLIRRIDILNCDETPMVDEATGVEGLTGWLRGHSVKWKKPKDASAFLAPPKDLAAWAKSAAASQVELPTGVLKAQVEMRFPAADNQRVVARALVSLPPDSGFSTQVEGKPGINLIVQGMVEARGRVFDSFRMRFQLPVPKAGEPVILAIDRSLRPGSNFVLRGKVIDEGNKAELAFVRGFTVPAQPAPEPEPTAAQQGQLLPETVAQGKDSIVLLPPASDVVFGTWRAEALVSGERIQKVVFLVDGKLQLTTSKKPFSAEVRLDRFPTEQTIRAEGYDGEGKLVAADDVIVNLQRGSLAVRIISPAKGAKIGSTVHARAEIVLPDEGRLQGLDFKINDATVASLTQPPWETDLKVPEGELVYLTAVVKLDNGSTAEAVRYLRSPRFVSEVEVNLVEMFIAATDNAGNGVTNLKQQDFEVFEDKRPQEIAKFELVDNLPLTLGIVLDTSGSMSSTLVDAQKAAGDFLTSAMKPRDKAFTVSFAVRPRLDMPLTDDIGALVGSLSGLQAVGDTALHDALLQGLYYFRGLSGQRALVLLSDGDDNSSYVSFDDVLEYARRSGVAVYTIGFHLPPFASGLRRKLEKLSAETGGRAYFTHRPDELPSLYKQIETELRSRYLVAFNSDAPTDKRGFREVEVRVKGGYKTRTARGYYP